MLSFRDVCQNSCRPVPFIRSPSADPGGPPGAPGRHGRTRPSVVVPALLVVVVAVDQAAKWWAWRHLSWTRINSGGDVLVGRTISAWYAGPVTGALLDLLDYGLLSIAVSVLARRRAPAAISVPGALMTGGWASNLLDRVGIHYWTAPGSVRGVVDFIHLGGHYYNVADFFIIGCTPLFLLAAGYQRVRAARRPAAAGRVPPPARTGRRGPDLGRLARRGELRRRERCSPARQRPKRRTRLVAALGAACDGFATAFWRYRSSSSGRSRVWRPGRIPTTGRAASGPGRPSPCRRRTGPPWPRPEV